MAGLGGGFLNEHGIKESKAFLKLELVPFDVS
jgi:hypothetical protein